MSLDEINDVERLKRINKVLVDRMERVTDQQRNAFSLFQTAISLDEQVRRRTDELTKALERLEVSNTELARQREIADEANQSKTRFLAAASHDILQPLQAAQLSVSALSDLQADDRSKSLVTQVERSLDTMNELLRTLLEISKLDARVMLPTIESVSLREICKSLQSDFAPVASNKGLELRFKIADVYIYSDRAMLRRVLQNLISNAIRYTNKGGVLIGTRISGQKVRVDVVDTGIGVSREEKAKIFDEFFRAENVQQSNSEEAAFGLGLAIVSRLIETLNHSIEVDTSTTSGSRFRVVAPLAPNAPIEKPKKSTPSAPRSSALDGYSILIVENDAEVRAAMENVVQSWGCKTRCATDLQTALSVFANEDWMPDCIIADQQLDHGDLGTDVIATIRRETGRNLPGILITANADEETARRAEEAKVELIQKPARPAEVRALLTHLLKGT